KPVEEALVSQLALAPELASGLGLKAVARPGAEADDLIAALCVQARAKGLDVVVVSTDKDLHQLLKDPHVAIWPGGKEPLRRAEYVKEKFGVEAAQLADYLAIVGDSSDNIPGVEGVGAKTAAQLLNTFGSLEKILQAAEAGAEGLSKSVAAKMQKGKDSAVLSRRLVELDSDMELGFPLEDCRPSDPSAKAAELFHKFEFRDLLRISAAHASAPPAAPAGEWANILDAAAKAKDIFLDADGELLALGLKDGPCATISTAALSASDRTALQRLVDEGRALITAHDLKNALRCAEVKPSKTAAFNCFDTMLACYCLNPSRAGYDFESMALEYCSKALSHSTPQEKLSARHALAWQLRDILAAQLEEKQLHELYYDMELPLLPVIIAMENAGVEIDAAALREFGRELAETLERLQSGIDEAAGWPVNANSPKQIGELLFEKLNLPHTRKTKTGYSTDEETLAALESAHPVVEKILAYREAAKLKATYVDGLLELINSATGRVHTHFNQNGTATGRLS
ncbi:MAG TPA: DNA polymerase, partial [Elusimicrobiales bacterium]|nr:DNA polymerase [Elusimicrobiales bacterium]